MKRILFLDDNPARCRWATRTFLADGNLLSVSATAASAIGWFRYFKEYDEVYLDHDLGDVVNGPSDSTSGMEVVRWIEEHRPKIGRVIVHSHSDAAVEMTARLAKAGYVVTHRSFMMLVKDFEEAEA